MRTKKVWILIGLLAFLTGSFYVSSAEAQSATNTASTTPIAPMVGYCTTNVYPGNIGEYNVQWTVFSNPATNVNYYWSGAASSSGRYSTVNERFNTSGRRTAVVTVVSPTQSMTLVCGADFTIPDNATSSLNQNQYHPIGGKCQASTSGLTVYWSAYSTGAQGTTTYNWYGDGFASTTNDASQLFEVTYPTEGVKSAQVLMQADGQTLALLCQAKVASTTSTGCFIATAAFGTEMEPQVATLRKFRDEKMMTNRLGESLVEEYYKISPPIADYIRNKPVMKLAVRTALRPVIWGVSKLE